VGCDAWLANVTFRSKSSRALCGAGSGRGQIRWNNETTDALNLFIQMKKVCVVLVKVISVGRTERRPDGAAEASTDLLSFCPFFQDQNLHGRYR
jgi:hypothetical protein